MRGKVIAYDKSTINAYYHLLDFEGDDEFTEYMRDDIDLEEVIKTLCWLGAEWKSKEREAISFSVKELSRYGKVWHYFICAKLMPTMHIRDVINDRAVLLYALVMQKRSTWGKSSRTPSRLLFRGVLQSDYHTRH